MGNDEFPAHLRQFPSDPEMFGAYRLPSDACTIYFASYPKGMSLEPHQHDDKDIIGVITHGVARLTISGEERLYRSGDWFHVPTSALHSAEYLEDMMEIEFLFPPHHQPGPDTNPRA